MFSDEHILTIDKATGLIFSLIRAADRMGGGGGEGETGTFFPGTHLVRGLEVRAPATLSRCQNTVIEQSL